MKALAITAAALALFFGLIIVVLAFLPGGQSGDSAVIIEVQPPAPAGDQRSDNGGGAPAEVDITGLNPQVEKLMETPEPKVPAPGEPLAAAPLSDVTEQSDYGPLPKIADNGARPEQVYAQPSKYTGAAGEGQPPRVAILVEGLAKADVVSTAIDTLPSEMSLALGPYGDGLQDWVDRARAKGHEVLLQVPLEPPDYPTVDPGPNTLLTSLDTEENKKRLHWLMSRFTGYVGVTNFMGGRFVGDGAAMQPVLAELNGRGLFYVGDGSREDSTAPQIAHSLGMNFAGATVRIGADASPEAVGQSLSELEAAAREGGAAIAVADASPETIGALSKWAAGLQQKGLVLVPVSAAVSSQS
ncbi:divergent polysaccharide deacetylase family protein [Methyloligella sp. 2.7D]|uniref:divergent polysaccharide deacetylase family protein n=1 Tax=unclassified Methyloligella TaxID=2625955 RepID=UPI00157C790A|nr:divergent polysaccharide deacetylase family protein [Methyloligella sp. GL2]QKP76365.1 divergent polysaccharide deacetylase family protein [Methyloligella sp. GL2]